MRILILGAGVVGTASAYYLRKAGFDVDVVDRQPNAGMETSFANGGQIAAAHAEPWAGPSTPWKALKWLGKKDAPLLFHILRYDPALWSWTLRFLWNCRLNRQEINTEKTLRVALYSREQLKKLRSELDIQYDQRTEGILHFYRDKIEFKKAVEAAEIMQKHGLSRTVLTPKECVAKEAALTPILNELVGGIYSLEDESGDAFKFTCELSKAAQNIGVRFHPDTAVDALMTEGQKVTAIRTNQGEMQADRYLVSMGSFSRNLLKPLGLNLPVYPAKGYSVTLGLTAPDKAPTVSLTDDQYKLVFSRLGDRLRVAGTAELGGYNTDLNPVRTHFILNKTLDIFKDCAPAESAEFWTGLRPKTPDSVPIIGKSAYDNLYLNTGHGTLGWTMSCGSGALIADIMSEQQTAISVQGLGLDRFSF